MAFVGSQSKLFEFSPWGTASVYEFPDAFERHAKAALGQDLPVLFLDHLQEDVAGVNYLDRPAPTILAGWKRGMISL